MFKKARFKLTAWYLLIIMVISFSFSGLIYSININEFNRFANSQQKRFEREFFPVGQNNPQIPIIDIDDLIDEAEKRLLVNLGVINGIILIISGSLSYFLAGITLNPIQQMTEDQKRFISDASHELKTPLTALKSLFEVSLRDKKITLIDTKKVIQQGIEQTDKLKNLSDSLLELSRFDNQKLTSTQTVLIKEIINDAVSQLQPKADKKNIQIITKIGSQKVVGNYQKLVELIIIFVDNAIKYSSNNTKINLITTLEKKNLLIKIIDQGIGIDQKDLPHIFDRFYQANNSRTKSSDIGYGLGLSIAKQIVDLHHGQIEVKSKLNSGTTFIIYLPLFS